MVCKEWDDHPLDASAPGPGAAEGGNMKHRFNLFYDLIYPLAAKIVGKRYGCCRKLKNCTRCCKKHGWDDWEKEE